MRCTLSLIEQRQDQAILRVVLNVGGMRGVISGSDGPTLAGRFTLPPRQIDDHLVLRERSGNIEHVDQQPFGVPIDGLGSCWSRAHSTCLGPGPAAGPCTVVPGWRASLAPAPRLPGWIAPNPAFLALGFSPVCTGPDRAQWSQPDHFHAELGARLCRLLW